MVLVPELIHSEEEVQGTGSWGPCSSHHGTIPAKQGEPRGCEWACYSVTRNLDLKLVFSFSEARRCGILQASLNS